MSNLQLQKSLDAFLVPGMMNLNVLDAFDVIGNLCHEMRESEILCRRLVTRLSFLRERALQLEHAKKVPAFADVLGHAIAFLKKYTPKKLLQRIALNRNILQGVRTLHREIDDLFKATELTSAAEMS
uniref:Uncharacterized protein n=1 Tax=Globisporangium ultimum (strain ATCC 200006 / CBS 805.95 / DAOM BR144) TaxID=431595 RepID=K3X5G5_GLOUD